MRNIIETMNCFNHPSVTAVGQCIDCGKGLCPECVHQYKIIICTSCNKHRRNKAIRSYSLYLIFYAILFTLGYKSNFMAVQSTRDEQILSGYLLMAVVSGWQFFNKIIPLRLVSGTIPTWFIYGALKLIASAFVGFFTAPFTILWNVIKLVMTFIKRV